MQRQLYASAAARKGWRFSATKSQLRWQNCRSFLQLLAALFSSAAPVAVYAITYPAVITGRPSRMCLLSPRVWCNQRGPPQLLLSWCLMSLDVIWHIRDKLWPMPKHGSIRKVYACLAVTCHLHFWQNDRDFLRATVVTRGWNGYRNKSQHRKSTLEKKILPPFQQGFEPATFQSRVRCSNHWAIPAPGPPQLCVLADLLFSEGMV